MVNIVDTEQSYKLLLQSIKGSDCIVIPVYLNDTFHSALNSLSLVIVYNFVDDMYYVLGCNHPDIMYKSDISKLLDECGKIFIYKKIDFLYTFEQYSDKLYDIDLMHWFIYGKIVPETPSLSKIFFQRKYPKLVKTNCIIPVLKLVEGYYNVVSITKELISSNIYKSSSYTAYNSSIIFGLYGIEKNGIRSSKSLVEQYYPDIDLHINLDKDILYTRYNPYTSTGRPTCRYNSINFTAMNKDTGCRNIITSRFDKGKLIEFDYESYHLRIIASIMGYQLPNDISVHEYLGRQYFGVESLTLEQYEQSKMISFRQLYGGVESEFKQIDYFNQVSKFVDTLWIQWNTQGYIETSLYKHRLIKTNYSDMNKSKLFNYFIQASETEYSMLHIIALQEYLKDRESKLILYTYDALLLDVSPAETKIVTDIQRILSTNNFPVKIKIGNTYHEMKRVKLNTTINVQ